MNDINSTSSSEVHFEDFTYLVGTNKLLLDSDEVVIRKGSYSSSNISFPVIHSQKDLLHPQIQGQPTFQASTSPLGGASSVSEYSTITVADSSIVFQPTNDESSNNSNSCEFKEESPEYCDNNCDLDEVPSFLEAIIAPPTAFSDGFHARNSDQFESSCDSNTVIPPPRMPRSPIKFLEAPSYHDLSPGSSTYTSISVFPSNNSLLSNESKGSLNVSDNVPKSGYSASDSETDADVRALIKKKHRYSARLHTLARCLMRPSGEMRTPVHSCRGQDRLKHGTLPSVVSQCHPLKAVIATTTNIVSGSETSHHSWVQQGEPVEKKPTATATICGGDCLEDQDSLPSEYFRESSKSSPSILLPQISSDDPTPRVRFLLPEEVTAHSLLSGTQCSEKDMVLPTGPGGDTSTSSSGSLDNGGSNKNNSTTQSPPSRAVPRFKGPRVPASRGHLARSPPRTATHRRPLPPSYSNNDIKAKHFKQNSKSLNEQGEGDDEECESDGDSEDDVVGLKGDEAIEDDASTSTDITLPNVVRNIVPPIRPSYFPNVPPYINFCLHDEKSETLPSEIRKHLKWRMSTITPLIIRKTVGNSGFRLLKKTVEWGGQWGKHMKGPMFRTTLKDYQKLNHLPATFQLGRKDRLWRNIYRFILKYGKTQFGFLPRTYILPHDMKQLKHAWDHGASRGSMWIVKPPAGARGTGIRVVNKWNQVPKKRPVIVQQYIAKPLLINDRKFDLRMYVLVTNFHPLRVYLYNDGLVRFAPVRYSHDAKRVNDRYMHLTNYSVNKNCDLYTQNEDANACKGHKWTLKTLWRYLRAQGTETTPIIKRIEDIIIKTLISAEECITASSFNMPNRYTGYELFGFDIIIDESFKPWLLEVNISPSLHSSSPLDLAVKGPLVKEVFNIVGYHLPPSISKSAREMFVERLDKDLELEKPVFDKRIYTNVVSKEEKSKQQHFRTKADDRSQYLTEILENLTSDDVRHLLIAEDELSQCNGFNRIFPTRSTHSYFAFFEGPRYYNMLMDAWESKHELDRAPAIRRLQELCRRKVHLMNVPTSAQPISENHVNADAPVPVATTQEKCYRETTTESVSSSIRAAKITNHFAQLVPPVYDKAPIISPSPVVAAASNNSSIEESTSASSSSLTAQSSNNSNSNSTDSVTSLRGPPAVKMERYVLLHDGGPRNNANSRPPAQISGDLYFPYAATTMNYHHGISEDTRINNNVIN